MLSHCTEASSPDSCDCSINAMGELDREAILGERLEQIHAQEQREQLRQMVKRKEKQERGEDSGSDDEQPLRTGRNRKATGTTDSKREQLERLKESRAEKGKKKDKHVRADFAPIALELPRADSSLSFRSTRTTTTTPPLLADAIPLADTTAAPNLIAVTLRRLLPP